MEFVWLILTGFALGLALIIPGISAGTMAVVFGIYERLIGIITPNVKKILAAWKFWLPLVIGAGAGIFFLSRLVSLLYERYPVPTVWFFIGVIAGSIPLVYRRVCKPASKLPSFSSAICAVIALALMLVFAFVNPGEGNVVYTELTLVLFAMLFLAGIFTSIAMLVPGISGSFLMLVIGLYLTVMQAISDLNISLLIPLALGIIAGLLSGAAAIRYLLAKVPLQTYGAVLGLVAGSVFVLYPGGFGEGSIVIFSLLSLIAGLAISFFLGGRKKAG